ncbi:hypothetical protein RhiirA5_435363 [Rhizophagus irregularis]|uniref:Uncharacterized protein n=2 Tax=Rhizophagus irregularis TaxID=588596 RepID=A0A2N0NNN2_9GLOM|nr:hypothetical protein RhiirA5_435363 [Rhizophagus irregularis]
MVNNNIEIDLDNEESPNRIAHTNYFTKCSADVNGELCICTCLDEKENRYGKTYRNMGSSTGNLLSHLDEAHQICLNNHNNKKYCTNKKHSTTSSICSETTICYTGEKKIRTMIGKSFTHNQQILHNIINETSQNISLTADFRSSRPKHGYLRITVVWITPTFEIKDVMSEIEYIPAPHTTETIATLKLFQVRI